ncbi:MAG: rhomboid family intramembrane serine protease [Sedimentisphaerales bacterium]|nr:rhomboid family intramembrane serine protease [Sedimentisphaerales bacterium]
MGLYDRDYTQADFQSEHRYAPQMRLNFPRLTPVVKWLIIINVAVFIPTFLFRNTVGEFFYKWFSVFPINWQVSLQLWRIVTYQFLHDILGFGHVFMNMLILFFFGPMLERLWGSKKFLIFYLVCGAMGGLFYPILAMAGWLEVGPLVGASGSILGMLSAAAILFPNSIVLLMFVFPMRLWVLAIILAIVSIMNLFVGYNSGGEAAHLAGMAAGAAYVFSGPWREKFKVKMTAGQKWEKKMTEQRNLQIELDRILDKVHRSGIHSLSSKEKRTLKKATKAEQMRNRF